MGDVILSIGGFIVLIVAMIWSAVWKALAMWKSARHKQTAWFVVVFIFNTLGILEIIYLAFFQKNQNETMPVVVQAVPAKKTTKKKK